MKWFKLHTEARNDAKLRSLSDSEHRMWFNLLCFAAEQEKRGTINDWQDSLLEWVDHIADTSKMIDMQDAIADAYRKHVGRCGLQTYAQTYRQGWQDALAWKGGDQ